MAEETGGRANVAGAYILVPGQQDKIREVQICKRDFIWAKAFELLDQESSTHLDCLLFQTICKSHHTDSVQLRYSPSVCPCNSDGFNNEANHIQRESSSGSTKLAPHS
ncbi:hypothetical protein LOK49_LG12G01877 [Camellia lanceoleosa]|uniref:Uncharacterized protein n=1 Tax=Camellia lanceoleosa TaxID=1840588 RepID=A0ACC0FPY0_9ERIC|nr:hypothetical protein LOK49_LG12G01877 [Camellia lanceoleosa]